MGSLEDRARAKVATDQAAAEERARQARQVAHQDAERDARQAQLEEPIRLRAAAALREFLQLVQKYHIPPFELRRARANQRTKRRNVQTRMTYEPIDMAWQLSPAAREWAPSGTSLAVTAGGKIFEFISCRDRMAGKRPRDIYLIFNECARAFYRGDWWDGRNIEESLRLDSALPTSSWEVDLLGGLRYPRTIAQAYAGNLRPGMAEGAMRVPPTSGAASVSKTWTELMVEAAAVAVVSGAYKLPPGGGDGDSTLRSEEPSVVWR